MEVSHTDDILESRAAQRLRQFVLERRQAWQGGTPAFESFERELHEHILAVEREILAAELTRYDVAAEQIEVGGVVYHPVWVDTETYLTTAGEVQVERHLYRPPGHNAKSLCPLEWRVGIMGGYWTPRAARQATFVMAQLTSGDAEALLAEMGAMCPSRGSLDRLPRQLSTHWEAQRVAWEAVLRSQETIPAAAASVALSVDGVVADRQLMPDHREPRLTDSSCLTSRVVATAS